MFVTPAWLLHYRHVRLLFHQGTSSDHSAIVIDLIVYKGGPKPFKFFTSWLRKSDFNNLFRSSWSTHVISSPIFILQYKLKMVKPHIKSWVTLYGNPKHEAKIISEKLHEAITKLHANVVGVSHRLYVQIYVHNLWSCNLAKC